MKHEPLDSDELPDYLSLYTNVVRERNGRNVVLGVDRETNQHGIEAGARVVVSSSWEQGHGVVKRVDGAAPIDGGAIISVQFDGDDGWTRVPATACMLEEPRE